MTSESKKIVLVPAIPVSMTLDFVFNTSQGVAVRVSDADIAALESAGVAYVELYATSNDYAADMEDRTRDQAIAAIESVQTTKLALLSDPEKGQFGLA